MELIFKFHLVDSHVLNQNKLVNCNDMEECIAFQLKSFTCIPFFPSKKYLLRYKCKV